MPLVTVVTSSPPSAEGGHLVIARSRTIQKRLAADFGIGADVVHPPPPPRAYRFDEYGNYILGISRLTKHKRVDLLVRALADAAAQHVNAVIAGDGDQRAALER